MTDSCHHTSAQGPECMSPKVTLGSTAGFGRLWRVSVGSAAVTNGPSGVGC